MGMYSEVLKRHNDQPCTNCGKVRIKGQWWGLNDYHGISGYFCPHCMDLVAHDPWKKPNNPKAHKAIAVKQMLMKATNTSQIGK